MYLLLSVWSPSPSSTCISHSIKYDHPSLKMRCSVLSCVRVFSHISFSVPPSFPIPCVCAIRLSEPYYRRPNERKNARTYRRKLLCDTQLLLLLNCHCRRFFLHIFPRFSVFSLSNSLLSIHMIYVRINAHASAIRIHCQHSHCQ